MNNPSPEISLDAQIECVQRELQIRLRTYGQLVTERRMSPETADREIQLMRAVRDTLEHVAKSRSALPVLAELMQLGNRLARGKATADEWYAAVAKTASPPIVCTRNKGKS